MLKFFTWVLLLHFAYFSLPLVFVTFSVCWTVIAILDIAFNDSKGYEGREMVARKFYVC